MNICRPCELLVPGFKGNKFKDLRLRFTGGNPSDGVGAARFNIFTKRPRVQSSEKANIFFIFL